MAFFHCHSCDWEQDDFYSKDGYNPVRYLEQSWLDNLFKPNLDEPFTDDAAFIKEHGNLSNREVLAQQFEKFAKRIRTMKWVASEQWEKEKNSAVCPKCGAQNFDID